MKYHDLLSDSPMQVMASKVDSQQIYSVVFHGYTFLFLHPPDFTNLRFFQKEVQLPAKLNLSYLHSPCMPPSSSSCFFLVTDYRQISIAPYLCRKYAELKIVCTKLAYELGRMYASELQSEIHHKDIIKQQMPYEHEQQVCNRLESQHSLDMQLWKQIYSLQQLQDTLTKCIRLNYGEIFLGKGINFVGFAAGINLGSAVWKVQAKLSKDSFVLVDLLSKHQWRHCKQFNEKTFKSHSIDSVDHLILSGNFIKSLRQRQEDDLRWKELLAKIEECLQKNESCQIILTDITVILDLVDQLQVRFKDKFKQVFIQSQCFNQLINYTNTYVEFLSTKFSKRISFDPPQYPFQAYILMKMRRVLYYGTLEDIALKQKIPIKELLLRSTPYIYFKHQALVHLNSRQQDENELLSKSKLRIFYYNHPSCFTTQQFKDLCQVLHPKGIYSYDYKEGIQIQSKQFDFEMKYTLKTQQQNHYACVTFSDKLLTQEYRLFNGELIFKPVTRNFLKISKFWAADLKKQFENHKIQVSFCSQREIYTENMTVRLSDGERIAVTGNSSVLHELEIMKKYFEKHSKPIQLR